MRRGLRAVSAETSLFAAFLPPPVVDLSPAAVSAWPRPDQPRIFHRLNGAATVSGAPAASHSIVLISPFVYEGAARDAILSIKYGKATRAVNALADLLADTVAARKDELFFAGAIPAVVPVPASQIKYLVRGFNLPSLLAVRIARRLELPFTPALRRTGGERPQAGLPLADRGVNVDGMFRVRKGSLPVAGPVLLVDDVLTSGATASECARALIGAGCGPIVVVTVCRADKRGN